MKKNDLSSRHSAHPASPVSPGFLGDASSSIALHNFPGYFLLACLIFSFVGLFFLVRPFWTIMVMALILASVFHPVYEKVFVWTRKKSALSAVLTCFLILVVFVLPITFFITMLGQEALDTYNLVLRKVLAGDLDLYLRWQKGHWFYDFMQLVQSQLGGVVDFQKIDLKSEVVNFAKNISSFLVQESAIFIKGLGSVFLGVFVMFFALYYFLKDSVYLTKKLMLLSPLPEQYDRELFRKFSEISKATLYGIFLTSVIQGILGGIAFALVGIPNGLFWGTAMAFFSLIPVVGTALIWLPAAIILLVSGNVVAGIALILCGVLLISSVDNILRVFFIGNQMNMNPLVAFLSVFGGLSLFGLTGVIFGPLMMMAFFTFLHIYQLEYKTVLKK